MKQTPALGVPRKARPTKTERQVKIRQSLPLPTTAKSFHAAAQSLSNAFCKY